MKRIIAYFDGFNLYFGLKDKGWRRYYWLNLKKLAQNLLKPDQQLMLCKYFTSRITFPPSKVKRQGTFIEALETLSDFEIFYGQYQSNITECRNCGKISTVSNEKMTDVNIAVELLSDAYENKFDSAILVSADSDLRAPVQKVLKLFPEKRIIVAFPPGRFSVELNKVASASFTIGRKKIADSVFDDAITSRGGYKLVKPSEW